MDNHTLQVLEFQKIKDRLAACASADITRAWIRNIRPFTDQEIILQKQRETTEASQLLIMYGKPSLSSITSMKEPVDKGRKQIILQQKELLSVADLLHTCERISTYFSKIKEDLSHNVVYGYYQNIQTNPELEKKIKRIIRSEDEIADDASPELQRIRRNIGRTQEALRDKLERMIRSSEYAHLIQDSLVTLRNDRFVIPVKQSGKSVINGIVHDTSSSGSTVFIEPDFSVEANNKIRELKIAEKREIERILQELTYDCIAFGQELVDNVHYAMAIDFAMAKADLSCRMRACEPIIENADRISIVNGRHPLLDEKTVVPIRFHIGPDFSALIVTGPNTGGKTVAIKTCGLFHVMAQAGLHVPADHGTMLPIYQSIYCDIGDEQSIEQSLSTFSSHMKHITHIMKKADKESLVLLDELGAGTDPDEGSALAMALLDELIVKQCTVMATTHYSDLKIYAFKNERMENASCAFDVHSLQPTYKLLMGVPGESNALRIAKRLGLDDHIVRCARGYLDSDDIKFEQIMQNIRKNQANTDRERQKAQLIGQEMERLKQKMAKEEEAWLKKKDERIEQASLEAKRLVAKAMQKADAIMKKMDEISIDPNRAKRLNEINDLKRDLRDLEKSLTSDQQQPQKTPAPDSKESYKPGQTVKIIKLDQTGTLLDTPDSDGKVTVQAGIMKVTVKTDEIVPIRSNEDQKRATDHFVNTIKRPSSVSLELDIRGHTLHEAIEKIDKYIDDVIVTGLNEVTIIHGKGTGALRSGVQSYLEENPRVEDWRDGKPGEGGHGVTVIRV